MFGFGKKKKKQEPTFDQIAEMTRKVNKATSELNVTTIQMVQANEKMLASMKRF